MHSKNDLFKQGGEKRVRLMKSTVERQVGRATKLRYFQEWRQDSYFINVKFSKLQVPIKMHNASHDYKINAFYFN